MDYLSIIKVQGSHSLVWRCRHKLLPSSGFVKTRCRGRCGTYVVCFLTGARQLFHLRTQPGTPVNCCRTQQTVRNQDLEANHPPGVDRLQRDTASWKAMQVEPGIWKVWQQANSGRESKESALGRSARSDPSWLFFTYLSTRTQGNTVVLLNINGIVLYVCFIYSLNTVS